MSAVVTFVLRRVVVRFWVLSLSIALFATAVHGQTPCTNCTEFAAGVSWGATPLNALTEASGLAASARNLGVLWTHNDGSRERVYALATNGAHLATFDFNRNVDDVEDIAVGPGPLPGISYIYVGDIGGDQGTNTSRSQVQVLRIAEPVVDLAWAGNSRSADFDAVEAFHLAYPDGSYDAEALMVDPVSVDIFIITKHDTLARVYRANLNAVAPGAAVTLQFVRSVAFPAASAADISPDGGQIIFRQENLARIWGRCGSESIGQALARSGQNVPVIGVPTEQNGEGIAFLRDSLGYATLSEGGNPPVYFFEALCPAPPRFTRPLADVSGFIGGSVTFSAMAVGFPAPAYQWHFNGSLLAGETNSSLALFQLDAVDAGEYQVTASNIHGVANSSAALTVRTRPDLRITEVQSSTAPSPSVPTADWWELTSFEAQAVDMSGWRFNDSGGDLTDPFTFPAPLSIAPGESIVFVEGLSPAQFRNWWGVNNLAPALQIVSYAGDRLSLGASGDGLRLWNNVTVNPADTIASVDFGAAQNGVTFNYDPNTGVFGAPSQEGVNGVFRAAASSGDIGSPGRIRAPAAPVLLTARLVGSAIRIEFDAVAGRRYILEVRDDLGANGWNPTGDFIASTNAARLFFEKDTAGDARFYRVVAE